MHKRAIAATAAALSAVFLAASPVLADSDYAGVDRPIDWRLVVIFILLGLSAFFAVLTLVNRGR
jgi:predicted permease